MKALLAVLFGSMAIAAIAQSSVSKEPEKFQLANAISKNAMLEDICYVDKLGMVIQPLKNYSFAVFGLELATTKPEIPAGLEFDPNVVEIQVRSFVTSSSGAYQHIELFDFKLGQWIVVKVDKMPNNVVRDNSVFVKLGNFAHPKSGEVWARVSWTGGKVFGSWVDYVGFKFHE